MSKKSLYEVSRNSEISSSVVKISSHRGLKKVSGSFQEVLNIFLISKRGDIRKFATGENRTRYATALKVSECYPSRFQRIFRADRPNYRSGVVSSNRRFWSSSHSLSTLLQGLGTNLLGTVWYLENTLLQPKYLILVILYRGLHAFRRVHGLLPTTRARTFRSTLCIVAKTNCRYLKFL